MFMTRRALTAASSNGFTKPPIPRRLLHISHTRRKLPSPILNRRIDVIARFQPRYGHGGYGYYRKLSILSSIPTVLVPPVVFVGLALTLWFYKCCMMVIFQNKIIYMPSIPPFSRSEKIGDYAKICGPVRWEEKRIRSIDGTKLALCVGEVAAEGDSSISAEETGRQKKRVVILYFQGNASSLPPRLPLLSAPLKALNGGRDNNGSNTIYTVVALSYRGYWTSRGRASQKGIELDAQAALRWVQETYGDPDRDTRLVLWGQSVGAGVATGALMQHLSNAFISGPAPPIRIHGMILETPFLSIKAMLSAVYPQKWLPYQYLWPFLRNWWDSEAALRVVGNISAARGLPILIIAAARDELVPASHADTLQKLCGELGLDVRRMDVSGALHTDATARPEGQQAVATFLKEMSER